MGSTHLHACMCNRAIYKHTNPKHLQTLAIYCKPCFLSTKAFAMVPSTNLFLLHLGLNRMVAAAHSGCGPHCPTPPPPSTTNSSCLIDTLKLGVCANVLNLLKLGLGMPPSEP